MYMLRPVSRENAAGHGGLAGTYAAFNESCSTCWRQHEAAGGGRR
jgi:hypothetical protein